MISNRNNVPPAYADKSRDYQVLLKLMDILINSIKSNIDNITNLLNPDTCANKLLPTLASYMEYDYDYEQSYDVNRCIMRYYPKLLKQKGNEIGIRMALLLSCNISGHLVTDLDRIVADYDYDSGTIYLYYPCYLLKVRDLIEVVRPAGMKVVMLPYNQINPVEVAGIYDDLMILNAEDYYGTLRRSDKKEYPTTYYIADTDGKTIIGIGTDSRSVISEEYIEKKSSVVPDTIDKNKYFGAIEPAKSTTKRMNSIKKSNDNLSMWNNTSRIGFAEIAGICGNPTESGE